MYFDKKLINTFVNVDNQEELFRFMSDSLYDSGCVKDSFYDGIVSRESEYPTGIQIGNVGFAIPHTDSKHVLESQICFVSLKKTILFADMTDINNKFPVNLVFMLAMKEPGDQIKTLQKLMEIFANEEVISFLLETDNKDEILNILKENGID
ncbi:MULTISPECIES: PTS sugar transporter subunit IIA [Streptococcus]|uniref:Phosphoenolpyruvate-dependent sugar PTS family porter, EIIA 2 n=1 Tax=Streptococcus anginosus DORA_7 TaxID=1403946 RepID=W1U195_STRAP|nr:MULTISPECIES: PTS sugar transporter subunit IIA [Streptococcus]ETI87305.1 MAG: Phosphoenolpyruvate-dependent sugar PTS family porter, EIIA 2 [Streptococcus anginosus DORA_7]MDU4548752.1 PTS sugar transporter subunit IIA [Clostridium botulinum]KAA9268133.1 PTS sugar transporter subunit IIA [Streptococcus anginosus]KAA9320193.1 PTS sugar transporter subunit IIA [Streptococcus anginosus]MCW1004579.1 PTS sugar transporter subunit IIA [Streptococcus anginosus]